MWRLDGELDAEGGAMLMSALWPLSRPRSGDDHRSPAQRRHDALVALARSALSRGDLPQVGGERPHLSVRVDLETLERRAGAPAAELAFGGPISGEAARRIACDASVSRVVTNGTSEILDVGRRTRVAPPAVRRALVARHGGCSTPGCDWPADDCEIHHEVHWADGGETNLEDCTLKCPICHWHEHEGRVVARGP